MKKLQTFFASIIFLSFLGASSQASGSHIVGSDLTYSWVSGNTYKVTLWLYTDCGPASAGAAAALPTARPVICIYNGSTYLDTISLPVEIPTTGTDVTPPLCPGVVSQCTSTTSTMPGIKLFRYSADYTLPSTSANWRFQFNANLGTAGTAGRAAAITNLNAAGTTTIELEATLNNTGGNNSNPILHIIPLPYYAINLPQTYNPVAIDADGDSLVYSLVDANTQPTTTLDCVAGGPATYISGLSGTNPLQTATGSFSMSTITGQMSFTPNVVQRGVVVYTIKEYRSGVLVGSLQREITVLVNSSTNALPGGIFTSSTGCTIVDTTSILACDTVGAFSATIPGIDADAADTINVTPMGLPVGATLTVSGNGTSTPVSTFSWNTTSVPAGLYTFFLKYTDGACPFSGVQTIAYNVVVTDCSAPSVSISDPLKSNILNVVPNPARNRVYVNLGASSNGGILEIFDTYGRMIKRETIIPELNVLEVNTSMLPAGIYIAKFLNERAVQSATFQIEQ
ncbi:MAG: T9SS type A sorting domain-containing protein [Taibaiella sp.]|nr:T9SS type A sorting domain-containing protein [Taibaiella sp.]